MWQLRCIATWGSASPHRFDFVAHGKFEVAQHIRCRLVAFYCWCVTLCCDLDLWPCNLDLWPSTLNICSIPAVPWSNSVLNFSAIEQSTAELLRFEYLTLRPWTRITCCAMMWDSLHNVWTQSTYQYLIYSVFAADTSWPWSLDLENLC